MGRAAPDFRIDDNGTDWTFTPLNPVAEAGCGKHMPPNAEYDDGYRIAYPDAAPVAAILLNHGFVLAMDGVIVGAKSP